jgi:hypothetical protein
MGYFGSFLILTPYENHTLIFILLTKSISYKMEFLMVGTANGYEIYTSVLCFVLVVMVLLLIDPSANKHRRRRRGVLHSIITWWVELWTFTTYDINLYNTNNGGEKNVNYTNWNTPTYRDVYVQNYIKQKDGSYKLITAKLDVFVNVDGRHEWSWLQDVAEYGWKCPKPPAEPSMFVSSDIDGEIQAILDEYNANKITSDSFKPLEIETKSDNSTEIEESIQQNTETY